MSIDDDAPEQVIRRAFRNKLMNGIGVVWLAVIPAMCIPYGFLERGAFAVMLWVLGAGGLYWIWRVLRSGIFVRTAGLEVRGWLRTTIAPWSEVVGFRQVSASALNSTVYIGVVLADGSVLKTSGLTSRDSYFGDEVMRELRLILKDHSST